MAMTDSELASLRTVNQLLAHLEEALGPRVPIQVARTFLAVATNKDQSQTEIAKSLGANISTTSRCLLDMGERNRWFEPGFGVISQRPDPMHLRRNMYSLTAKGAFLAMHLVQTMALGARRTNEGR